MEETSSEICAEALRAEYMSLIEGILALNAKVDVKLKVLEEKERHYNATLARVKLDKIRSYVEGQFECWWPHIFCIEGYISPMGEYIFPCFVLQ